MTDRNSTEAPPVPNPWDLVAQVRDSSSAVHLPLGVRAHRLAMLAKELIFAAQDVVDDYTGPGPETATAADRTRLRKRLAKVRAELEALDRLHLGIGRPTELCRSSGAPCRESAIIHGRQADCPDCGRRFKVRRARGGGMARLPKHNAVTRKGGRRDG